jgi:hypothetical protein
MTTKRLIVIGICVTLLPTIIFGFKFFFNPISDSPTDWETFAVYLSGTTGTLSSIFAGWLLYLTLKSQNKQSVENSFFNYLETFSKEKEDIGKKFILFDKEMYEQIHKKERVQSGSQEEKLKKAQYLNYVKDRFIAGYSLNSRTPRLNDEYNKFFRSITNFGHLIYGSDLDKKDRERLRDIFLSIFSDAEIKLICYYYYLLFDIINSTDKDFTSNNHVRNSGLFDGSLNFSDDFLHNFDPREGHFNEVLEELKDTFRKKRS